MKGLPPEALEQVAAYFQALSEPMRLRILNELRSGERNVSELAEGAASSVANVSRHLGFLMQRGLVERESRGTAAYYRIADPAVYKLCDLVCDNVARQHERQVRDAQAFVRATRRGR